ncbi:bifunctional UDP-N-acetylglucosamine diphosphorylase/glucosamine-1-phosphate N-acetyltransferase GlmU [Rhodococcus sp. D2-41]|uniref:bifunctional UDP-N-acetylglucosamine diphosphorylase/glucosamine-1-phosphate N-acetyltransferase GlmU n=1 Tax=Speluncibacter jeojiensis TaxID=2710754 RepID=UPI00240EEC89|nr:bifunctional UDP-N-acetylglucosamine diphosphorylase/glucosamine-1-phosphate N-acetyltransferase GlmU [Rhodococcus sp. D2-41]MDG3012296.1 bifunctional UDP-N-acetylglucosamine diphosphorylase/glucosamine-1-phosphate N-acetyltransferase GlmU [Rhodococcus sp. D2-41]
MPVQTSPVNGATAVVVLAAGAGTRMRSATPKVLHRLAGRTMLAHSLRAGAALNPDHLVTVIGHQADQVGAAVADLAASLGRDLGTALQEQQNGTGHAVGCALAALPADFAGTVLVTAADVPLLDDETLTELLAVHAAEPSAAVTVLTCTAADPTGYGRILRTHDGEVTAIVEQADATDSQRAITEVNSGVYAFDAVVLRGALAELSSDNAQGELYLTDVIAIARRAGKSVRALHIEDATLVAGVNDRVQLATLSLELNRRILERWMRAGVTVLDPTSTFVDVDVTLERDVVLRPGVQLHGATVIGEGAEIGPDTTLTDVQVGAEATVVRTHGSGAEIGPGATVGPFSYLRPGTILGAEGKIGTFVETKKATIGVGSKVPHLTYVGDATIGDHSNIGASSVFVNYDGVHKHHTVVGSHVRTGSDTMFVAPLTVGDGAYTGAGTVLREDVPAGALAINDSRQINVEGWVQRRRPDTGSAKAAAAAEAATNSPQDASSNNARNTDQSSKDGEDQ